MKSERYNFLMNAPDDLAKLTKEEFDSGWHWCFEFDGLLVGPGMNECFVCSCKIPGLEEWKKTPDGAKAGECFKNRID